jgi:hypothetical protein
LNSTMKELFDRLTGKEKTTLAALAAGTFAVLLVLVFVSLGEKRIYGRSQEALGRLGGELGKARASSAEAVGESKRWEEAERDLEGLKTKYFYDDGLGIMGLRRDLERIFGEAGIRVSQISYNYEDLERGKIKRVVASFNFRGPYISLKRFLAVVERFPKFLTIEKIDFLSTGSDTGSLDLKIELAGYYEI